MTSVTSTECSERVWSIRGNSIAVSARTAKAFLTARSRSFDFEELDVSLDIVVGA